MPSSPDLRLDWCSHAAAKYAVERWHYSRSMPVGKMVTVGVREGCRFVGAVVFSQGNNQFQGVALGLTMHQVCELTRVALDSHRTAVSRVLSLSVRMLKRLNPGLCCVVSYADPEHGHHGGIYQAAGWIYIGRGGATEAFYTPSGQRVHSRLVSASGEKIQFGIAGASFKASDLRRVSLAAKFKYLLPLNPEIRARILPLAKPYPKRAPEVSKGMPRDHRGGDGATPIPALHFDEAAR